MPDGLANTIALAEMSNLDRRNVQGTFATNQSNAMLRSPLLCQQLGGGGAKYQSRVELSGIGRGGRWADGGAGIAMMNTILPPGSPSCSIAREAADGIYSAGSFHTGGLNVAMADGSIQFISSNIDCGDVSRCPPEESDYAINSVRSPFGVWGALGSASSGDAPEVVQWE